MAPPRFALAFLYTAVVARCVLWPGLFIACRILIAAEPQAPGRYVDSRVCATCHPAAAEAYLRTGMGRSFYRPSAGNMAPGDTVGSSYDHTTSGTHYEMTSRDGAWYQRRSTLGF